MDVVLTVFENYLLDLWYEFDILGMYFVVWSHRWFIEVYGYHGYKSFYKDAFYDEMGWICCVRDVHMEIWNVWDLSIVECLNYAKYLDVCGGQHKWVMLPWKEMDHLYREMREAQTNQC